MPASVTASQAGAEPRQESVDNGLACGPGSIARVVPPLRAVQRRQWSSKSADAGRVPSYQVGQVAGECSPS
jgi:hypothetical protein